VGANQGIFMTEKTLFDEWPERYEQWFTTPIGKLVKAKEAELVLRLLDLKPGEKILDAGCGTGIFTLDYLERGAEVVGLDISRPMLRMAGAKAAGYSFDAIRGDMLYLSFKAGAFDRVVSVTALEFIEDGRRAVAELFRVTRPGGRVVVATLNSLSPWAARRRAKTQKGQRHILEQAFFRSPEELLACSPLKGLAETCIHFQKDDAPDQALVIEEQGRSRSWNTGAFVAACWDKPALYQV
jgi:ubiquinone/menaquinone biosynthesis C-methylase UbiE